MIWLKVTKKIILLSNISAKFIDKRAKPGLLASLYFFLSQSKVDLNITELTNWTLFPKHKTLLRRYIKPENYVIIHHSCGKVYCPIALNFSKISNMFPILISLHLPNLEFHVNFRKNLLILYDRAYSYFTEINIHYKVCG